MERATSTSATSAHSPLVLVCLILAIYAASFALPIYTNDDGTIPLDASGAAVFRECVLSMYLVFTWPAVAPNLLLVLGVGLLAHRSWGGAGACGGIGLAGAILVAVLAQLGDSERQLNLASGYYAWASSMALLAVAGWWGWWRNPRPARRCESGYARLARFVRSKQLRDRRP